MSRRDPKLLVGDILESAYKILDYTAGLTFEDFTKDSKTVMPLFGTLRLLAKQPIGFLKNLRTIFQK